MKVKMQFALGFVAVSLCLSGLPRMSDVVAADLPKSKSSDHNTSAQPTTEERKTMAALHEKMAECLRSEKPINECRTEMMRSCRESMGKDGCPMMGHRGGRMHAPERSS